MKNIHVDIFDVTETMLSPLEAENFVDAPGNGAACLFVGKVREFNQGRHVLGVSYDVFDILAKNSFLEICKEICQQYKDPLRLYVAHGKGRLNVGGISIVIAAGSPHRDEAFKACRYIIEQIKHRSPIWKQEHYNDGNSEWVQGHALCSQH